MSTEEELKWMTKRYSWRYIPFRYQAMVATITAGFLYFNAFEILFSPTQDGGACGSIFRPALDDSSSTTLGGIFDSLSGMFTFNEDLVCKRHIQGQWWELFATFAALAICGLVMRRAIKRDEATRSS
jgi:hypothetical protein